MKDPTSKHSSDLDSPKDTLFSDEAAAPVSFRFDEAVARVFPDMLRRSIPGYSSLLHLIGVHAARDLVPVPDHNGNLGPARVYDLGCSLGAVSLTVRHALGAREAHICAVDNSAAMVRRCREIVSADCGLCPVEVKQADIVDFELAPCSLVVLNFTLQFAPMSARQNVLEHIFDRLVPGGSLVLSEKTSPPSPDAGDFYQKTHDAFREENGYSQLELSRKRQALENVLLSESEQAYEDRLTRAGFSPIRWFQCLQFVSWVAKKPHGSTTPNERARKSFARKQATNKDFEQSSSFGRALLPLTQKWDRKDCSRTALAHLQR